MRVLVLAITSEAGTNAVHKKYCYLCSPYLIPSYECPPLPCDCWSPPRKGSKCYRLLRTRGSRGDPSSLTRLLADVKIEGPHSPAAVTDEAYEEMRLTV